MLTLRIKGKDYQVRGLPELDQWRREGRVTDDTPVYDGERGEWRKVGDLLPLGTGHAAQSDPPPAATAAPPSVRTVVVQKGAPSGGRGSGGNVLAALCSFFIPGLGQLLQGRIFTAIEHFVLAIILWIFLLGWIVHIWSIVSAATYKPKPGFFDEISKEIRFKECPHCRSEISKKATICPHCQSRLDTGR